MLSAEQNWDYISSKETMASTIEFAKRMGPKTTKRLFQYVLPLEFPVRIDLALISFCFGLALVMVYANTELSASQSYPERMAAIVEQGTCDYNGVYVKGLLSSLVKHDRFLQVGFVNSTLCMFAVVAHANVCGVCPGLTQDKAALIEIMYPEVVDCLQLTVELDRMVIYNTMRRPGAGTGLATATRGSVKKGQKSDPVELTADQKRELLFEEQKNQLLFKRCDAQREVADRRTSAAYLELLTAAPGLARNITVPPQLRAPVAPSATITEF